MSRRTENEAWHAGFTACANEHMKQRQDPEYPITRTVPERYQWPQDYNETLISQAGGDGDNARRVQLEIVTDHDIQPVQFTNVPMHRVHAAIALLNGDGEDELPTSTASYDGDWQTKDFTVAELFPDYEHTSICVECGVFVYPAHLETHTTWHNKTLP